MSVPEPAEKDRTRERPVAPIDVRVVLEPRTVWRAGWVVVGVVALALVARWVLADGGSVIFTLILSFLASVAMEPAVARLSLRMRRGVAAMIVMVAFTVACALFLVIFGRLLGDQIAQFVQGVPALASEVVDWANRRFGASLDAQSVMARLNLTPAALNTIAANVAGGVLGFILSVVSAAFSTFTFAFFTFYFSADAPRLRRWIAQLFPPRQQEIVVGVWDLAVIKTGGYLSARVVLAAICGTTTGLFLLIIGMPYWLALGIWTGVVAQFVPTIGTYVAILLPVMVGLIGDEPHKGIAVLIFAVVYQQIENLTIEPRISAAAVDVHPAVSFAAVLFGASLFGVAGAFVAVPVAAMMLTLFDIYTRTYDVLPHLDVAAQELRGDDTDGTLRYGQRGSRWFQRLLPRRHPREHKPASAPPG
jgi:predicted PurR-regulated permease PerM